MPLSMCCKVQLHTGRSPRKGELQLHLRPVPPKRENARASSSTSRPLTKMGIQTVPEFSCFPHPTNERTAFVKNKSWSVRKRIGEWFSDIQKTSLVLTVGTNCFTLLTWLSQGPTQPKGKRKWSTSCFLAHFPEPSFHSWWCKGRR